MQMNKRKPGAVMQERETPGHLRQRERPEAAMHMNKRGRKRLSYDMDRRASGPMRPHILRGSYYAPSAQMSSAATAAKASSKFLPPLSGADQSAGPSSAPDAS